MFWFACQEKTLKTKTSLIIAALLGAPIAANAVPTTYFGEDLGNGEGAAPIAAFPNSSAAQASFLAGLLNPGVENFESLGGSAPLAVNFANGTTATLNGTGAVAAVANGTTNGVGRFGISGDPDSDGFDRYWDASGVFSINFSNPVSAFGFFGIDIGDFDGQVTASTSGGLNQVFNVGNSTNIAGGSVLFWGVIDPSNTFTSVSFGNTASGVDVFGFDNFTVGTPEQVRPTPEKPPVGVPEPGMLLLFGTGLAALGLAPRRRRYKI
jgi:hypothetical protein